MLTFTEINDLLLLVKFNRNIVEGLCDSINNDKTMMMKIVEQNGVYLQQASKEYTEKDGGEASAKAILLRSKLADGGTYDLINYDLLLGE